MVKKTLIFSLLLLTAMVGPAVAFDLPELYTTIQVNPGLRGDALLGYLYDVRDLDGVSQKTLINIVNTDPVYGMVARVRFREYKRSKEVLDFHIPLSKGDVWSAEIYRCTAGPGAGRAFLYSEDWNSIDIATAAAYWPLRHDLDVEDPVLPCNDDNPHEGMGVPFSTVGMESGGANIARTLYGYYEIIGEERVSGDFDLVNHRVARLTPTTPCGAGFTGLNPCGMDAQNSLFAETWLVRVQDGTAQQYQDIAIQNFSVNVNGITANVTGTVRPNLQADVQGGGNPGFGGFGDLEALLSKRYVFAQYWDDTDFAAKTSVVFTFPTKWAHFDSSFNVTSRPFVGPKETIQDGNPDPFLFVLRDREEHILTIPTTTVIFSPFSSSGPNTPRWPFEVNILGVYDHAKTFQPISQPPHSVIDGLFIFRDNVAIYSFVEGSNHFTEGWVNFDLSPNNNADGQDPVSLAGPLPAGVTGEQGATVNFNFWEDPANATNFVSYRGLPVIGGVLTEVTHTGLGLNYRTAVPWASAVDWTAE
jgi:hypothetical protein